MITKTPRLHSFSQHGLLNSVGLLKRHVCISQIVMMRLQVEKKQNKETFTCHFKRDFV